MQIACRSHKTVGGHTIQIPSRQNTKRSVTSQVKHQVTKLLPDRTGTNTYLDQSYIPTGWRLESDRSITKAVNILKLKSSLMRKTLFADSIDSLSGVSAPQQQSTAGIDSLAMVCDNKKPTQDTKRRRGKKDKWKSFANKTSSVLMELGNQTGKKAQNLEPKHSFNKVTLDSLAQLEERTCVKAAETFDDGGVLGSLASLSLNPKVPITRGRSSDAEKVSTAKGGLTSLFGGSAFELPRSKVNDQKKKSGFVGGIGSLFAGDEFSTKKPNSKTEIVQKNKSDFGGLMGLMGVTSDDARHQKRKALGKQNAKSKSDVSMSSKHHTTFEGIGALSHSVEKRPHSLNHVGFAGVLEELETPFQDMGNSEMGIDDDESSASSFIHRKRGKDFSPKPQIGAKRLDRKKTPGKNFFSQNVADFVQTPLGQNVPPASPSICSTVQISDEFEGVPLHIQFEDDQYDHCSLSVNPAIVNCGRPWEEIAEDQSLGDESDDTCSESVHGIPNEILASSSMKDSSLECTGIFSSLSLSIGGEANHSVCTNTAGDIVKENVSDSQDTPDTGETNPRRGRPRKSRREAKEAISKDTSSDEKTATNDSKPRRGRPRKSKSGIQFESKDMPLEAAKTNTRRSLRARAPPDRFEPPSDNRQEVEEEIDSDVSIEKLIKHVDEICKSSDTQEQTSLHEQPQDVSMARRSTRTRSATDRFGSYVADQSEAEEDEFDHPSVTGKKHLDPKRTSQLMKKSLPPAPKVPMPVSSSNGWTVTQLAQLKRAHSMINPGSKTFWDEVAARVDEKNAEECKSRWFSRFQTPQRRKPNPKAKVGVDTGGVPDDANDDDDDDDIFNSTPMRGLDLQGNQTSFFGKPSAQVDLGSAIKANNDETSAVNDDLAGATPLTHLQLLPVRGHKSYVRGMKRDLSKNQKKQSKGRKAPPKPIPKTTVPRLLTEKVHDADVQMNVRLTPGGTVKVKDSSGADDDDLWDEMYGEEED